MPNPDSTVEGTIDAMKTWMDIETQYPIISSNGNGGFKRRSIEELEASAEKAANRTMSRYREAAIILAKNKKEMDGIECGLIDEGNSIRKDRAIKELLK